MARLAISIKEHAKGLRFPWVAITQQPFSVVVTISM